MSQAIGFIHLDKASLRVNSNLYEKHQANPIHGIPTLKSLKLFLIVLLHKNCSFPLRISSVNATKSAGKRGFTHIH